MRQRELFLAKRHGLPEGGAELAGVALVKIGRQIDERMRTRIAANLLILGSEDVGRLSSGQP